MIVGVDIGGTFTDCVAVDPATGQGRHHKLPSTPSDPSEAVLTGLAQVGIPLEKLRRIIHGTTVATNAMIQRRGARTGVITTMGHRDVLEIRRGNKPEREVFNTLWRQPSPLVDRYLRLDIDERLDYLGREVVPLDLSQLAEAARYLAEQSVESVAICFLFSYMDDCHEREAADWLRANHPRLDLSLSSEILPQWREYERFATTIADAYVKPTIKGYVGNLAEAMRAAGFERDLLIMKSNGGIMTAATACDRPVDTFLSGPAGGVVAGKHYAQLTGHRNVITLDMGGTSSDVSLVTDGELSTTTEGWIDESTPLGLPMLDIRTVGAGGGSIASVDAGGALKVGPRSAGAVPGPACYGAGGSEPTVTDANVVLGRLGPDTLLAGRLRIDPDLARSAIEAAICAPLGISLNHAASGIISICVANMSKEIRALTAERGVDPRTYALLVGGGGGPLHGAALAREFGIKEVVVPAFPGLLSAAGLILSDLRIDRIMSFPTRIESDGVGDLAQATARLRDDVLAALAAEGFDGVAEVAVTLNMRYVGQNWDINVPVDGEIRADAVASAFDARHDQLYGFALPDLAHEVLSIRASAVGPAPNVEALVPRRFPQASSDQVAVAPSERRSVWDNCSGSRLDTDVYAWSALPAGAHIRGPAVIEGVDSTIWVPSDCEAAVDAGGNVVLTSMQGEGSG